MNASCHLNPNKRIRAGQPALSRGLYTNVTECGCFSVCADKLFKVPGMSVIVPSSTLPPFCSPFCVCCSSTVPQIQKRKNAKRFATFALPHFSLPNVVLYGPTSGRRYCQENKAELRPRTTSDGDSLLLPPFHRFAFLILPSFTPLILVPFRSLSLSSLRDFIFKALMFPVGLLWWLTWKWKEEGESGKLKSESSCFFFLSSD